MSAQRSYMNARCINERTSVNSIRGVRKKMSSASRCASLRFAKGSFRDDEIRICIAISAVCWVLHIDDAIAACFIAAAWTDGVTG